MSINVNDKNLGHATAYAYYKAGGGTMTEAEFAEFMADFGTASQTAVEAAQAALASKNAAQTAATTATNKATEATTAATTATTKAGEASTSASTATSAKDTAVSASQTATSKATEATTAAATATSAATTATTAKDDAVSAKTAAQTAQTGAETAAASVSASAAQIATNTDDIAQLKSELSETITLDAERVLTGSINADGKIISADGYGVYSVKVHNGYTYTVNSHDPAFALLCAFYRNEPAVNETSYNGSRITSQTDNISVTAPFDGWLCFRSAETKTDESASYVSAVDKSARTETANNKNSIDNYRKQHAYIPNINLFGVENLVEGYWIKQNGTPAYSATSYYALIPVAGGNDVVVCFGVPTLYMDAASIGGFVEYDADMNQIAVKNFGDARLPETNKYNGSWVGKFTLGTNTKYIAFTVKLSSTWDARSTLIVAYDEDLSTYSGQGNTMLSWDGFKFHSDAKWLGKKWCVVGDSLTAVNATADKKYYSLIQDNTGISVENVAVSGSGYAKKASSNESFVHQVQSIPNDTDVVTIFGSGNDNTAELQLGSITDSGTTTLCGCVNTVIDYMIANHPTVAFGIITPTPWANWEPSDNLYWMAEYSEAIVKICNRRGVPCLDLYHCSNLHPSDASFNAIAFHNADGTHPNNVGHAIIAPRIEAFLDSLI